MATLMRELVFVPCPDCGKGMVPTKSRWISRDIKEEKHTLVAWACVCNQVNMPAIFRERMQYAQHMEEIDFSRYE